MRIGLIDVDGHNFPNLPLMKLSAWHRRHGDTVEWYEPMFSGHMDRVYMSKVFGFSPDYQYFIDADEVIKGGSGYCIELENRREIYHSERDHNLPYEIEHIYPDYEIYYDKIPGMQKTAYGRLTLGCPRGCGFCHTGVKDGLRSHKVADLSEFWDGQKNIVLLDQNILAAKEWRELLQQLIDSKSYVEFNGGLDIRFMTEEKANLIRQIKLKMIHFAWDRYQDKDIIVPRLKMFREITGYDRHKVMVYMLCNYDSTFDQDLERAYTIRDIGLQPYVMLYDKEHLPVGGKYRKLQRWVNNPFVFMRCRTFEEYQKNNSKGA